MAQPGHPAGSGDGELGMEGLKLDDNTAKIRIETGDIKDCGTNAQVYVTLYGDKGNTGEITLGQPDGGYFEQGVTSVFGLRLPTDIGKPYKLRLRHDNSGKKSDWFVDKIILQREKFTLEFPFEQWLSNKKGDKVIITEVASIESRLEVLRYDVAVKTGKERNAGTDANCWVKIFGEQGDTGQRWLSNNIYLNRRLDKFEKGKTDEFKIHAVDLGKITELVVGHDSKKKGDDWYVEHVVVKCPSGGPQYWFPCRKWIRSEGHSERKLVCQGTRNDMPADSDSD